MSKVVLIVLAALVGFVVATVIMFAIGFANWPAGEFQDEPAT